ncbi:MAG: serine/threonine-protein kinase [Planctomycetota bacterium]
MSTTDELARYWSRVTDVFTQVMGVAVERRGALLAELCGSDARLAAEVRELIELDTKAAGFLGGPLRALDDVPLGTPGVDPFVGRKVGGFEIERFIAAGGMGSVYQARQLWPTRTVALKILPNWLATPERVRRFTYEAEVLAQLEHPNIARLYEAGAIDLDGHQLPYFAMELIVGARSIQRYVAEARPGLRATVELLAKVCDAVHFGHLAGVLHRDLKPSNILIDAAGQPKLIDFGIARSLAAVGESTVTRAGDLLGTVTYMSPEQCSGKLSTVGARSDVYALGVVLYELLCGAHPHHTAAMSIPEKIAAIQQAPATPPRRLRPELPKSLEWVLLHALERAPDLRYQSAAEFGADLRRFLAGIPVHSAPPSHWRTFTDWVRRHPVLASASASCAVIVVSVFASWLTYWFTTLRPDSLELDSKRSRVQLLSATGRVLHTWESGPSADGVSFAVTMRDARGERLAAIAYGADADTDYRGQLCVSSFADPARVRWHSSPPSVAPAATTGGRVASYRVFALAAIDCFPEAPGDELLLVQRHGLFAACLVRVFDADGRTLYQVWHNGHLSDVRWLPHARRFVFAGVNSELRWDERGIANATARYPQVIFAVAPIVGHVTDQWLCARGASLDRTLCWYRWLGPESHAPLFGLVAPSFNAAAGSRAEEVTAARFCLRDDGPHSPYVMILFDADGVMTGHFVNDGYEAEVERGVLPPSERFRLEEYRDLPVAVEAVSPSR